MFWRTPGRLAALPLVIVPLAVLLAAAAPGEGLPSIGFLPGKDGGWDYASVDGAHARLYVARGEDVSVVDLDAGKPLPAIGSLARGHAVVPIAGSDILMVTSGHDDSVRFLDVRDGNEVGRVTSGTGPDAAFYSAELRLAVVMNAKSGTVSVIDPSSRTIVRSLTLKPGLEFGQALGTTLFVNNEIANELETGDLVTGVAGKPISLGGCESPSGLALDAASGMLISACSNNRAVVVDARRKQVVKELTIGARPDAVILDAKRRRAYIPCGGDGTLAVIALDRAGGPTVIATIPTAIGARTGAVDPRTGWVYLPTAEFAPAQNGEKPKPLPGTFHILVIDPAVSSNRHKH